MLLFIDSSFWIGTGTGVALLIAAIAFVYYNWGQGNKRAQTTTISTWKGLYESEHAKNLALEDDKKRLGDELAATERHLEDCKEMRDEFARQNLRLNARQEKLEKCINRLEVRIGLPETNFEDPTSIHSTLSPGRHLE